MNKDFVPYEKALALKELGFNEPCFGYYYTLNGKDWNFAEKTEYFRLDDEMNIGGKFTISAPLYQQAFRWFRENYNLFGQVNIHTYFIYKISNDGFEMIKQYDKLTNTYEEAELACLKKLIEIVKKK
jgi:hypothetical protein